MAISHIRVLGVFSHSPASYIGLTDIDEACTLDVSLEGSEVRFGAIRKQAFTPPDTKGMSSTAETKRLAQERRYGLVDMLADGLPDAFAAFGAAAVQQLGILSSTRWICLARCAVLLQLRKAVPLAEMIRIHEIRIPGTPGEGAETAAWQTAALLQDLLQFNPPERLVMFSRVNCQPCVPPPDFDDDEAWARVPCSDLSWMTTMTEGVPFSAAARAECEKERREREGSLYPEWAPRRITNM